MSDRYVLGNQKSEIDRLDIQASFFEPFAREAFQKAGIEKGMRCLDVGCGSGSVTRLMAEMVGAKGNVVGVDIDDKYLQYCKSMNTNPRIKFVHQDICLATQTRAYDVAFSRFMFVHLKDPRNAVRSMKEQVKEGGRVIIQELDHSADSWLCYPYEECVNVLREAFVALVKKSGSDPLSGRKLYKMLVDESLDARVECFSPCLMMGHEPYCSLGWRIAESLKPQILQHGLMTEKEYNRLYAELKSLAGKKDHFVTYARFFSVTGFNI